MRWESGTSVIEGMLVDRVQVHPEPGSRLPVRFLDDAQVAAELGVIQRNRARDAAREAELILRLAELRPDVDDPPPGTPGARRSWRKTDPEFPGVSEFFPDELAHAINLGRGTAAFRARRAFTWQQNLPATFAALQRGALDERRGDVLADALQTTSPHLAQAVETALLPEAAGLSPAELRRRALALLAELDADAITDRHDQAKAAADVRAYPTTDGMAALTADLPAEQAAACYQVINDLAAMAKADGDPRPIGAIRADILAMLILRPTEHGQPGISVHLAMTATLDTLEERSTRGGEVNGFTITAGQLRDLLRRVDALGLRTPAGGSLTFAVTDEHGQLLATLTPTELARLARTGCPHHPPADATATPAATATSTTEDNGEDDGDGESDGGCDCSVTGLPPATDSYTPTAAQRRFITTRDRRCRTPNCGQRAGWSDHDHVLPHATGGRTTCTNLCCLCRSHHRLKTFAPGWTFRMDPDGTLHVTSPSGVTRTTRPPGLRGRLSAPPRDDPPDDPPPF